MSRTRILLPVLLILFAVLTCAKPPAVPDPPRALTAAEARVVSAFNVFGLDLFRQTVSAQPDQNLFISPLSVSLALGMTLNGAAGDTAASLKAVLGFGDLPQADVNAAYRGLIDLLRGLDPQVTLELANAIWHNTSIPVKPEFLSTVSAAFDAQISPLSTAEAINAWVRDRTHNKIDNLVDQVDPSTLMFLVNALYFKGTWTTKFPTADTRDAAFHVADATAVTCPFMTLKTKLPWLETDQFTAVDLPYGSGKYAMALLLPKQGVAALAGQCTAAAWTGWLGQFVKTEDVTVTLPRFKLASSLTLNDALRSLGLDIAFGDGADFGNMTDADAFISEVKHKSFVEVNEEGTEAAAVTSVEIGLTAMPVSHVIQLDRPFLFAIHDTHSQTVLFIGQVMNPLE